MTVTTELSQHILLFTRNTLVNMLISIPGAHWHKSLEEIQVYIIILLFNFKCSLLLFIFSTNVLVLLFFVTFTFTFYFSILTFYFSISLFMFLFYFIILLLLYFGFRGVFLLKLRVKLMWGHFSDSKGACTSFHWEFGRDTCPLPFQVLNQ